LDRYFTPTQLSENIHETPEGFLVCYDVLIGRTGDMVYGVGETPIEVGNDGKVIITRSAEELFHPDTIASFEGKAFTIKHPEEFVNPDNWSDLAKGVIQNVRRSNTKDEDGEESLMSDILVTDALAIQLVKAGLREVSCGYEAVYESTGKGTGIQTKIIGNHLALVDQGRAGSSYAIMDQKYNEEKSFMSKFEEYLKNFFTKDATNPEKKEGSKDAVEPDKKDDKKVSDANAYDELVKMVKDLGEKMESMNKPKDADPAAPAAAAASEGGDEPDVAPGLESRLKSIEAALAKLMEKMSVGDEDEEDDETDDEADPEMVGDTASRAEILAPGIRMTKDVKAQALKTAYATEEGKKVIDSLSAGKPTFDSASNVSTLFIAASEVLRARRGTGLGKTRNPKAWVTDNQNEKQPMTAEKMNELNQAFWNQKK
jgi:hypothetical protein